MAEQEQETKQQVTKKFIIGVVLIVVSLAIGKLVLIPIILFPGNKEWRTGMIILYAFGWVLLVIGIALAGWEGYRLVTHKYKHYKRRTVRAVKRHGRHAAAHTKKHVNNIKNGVKNGVIKNRKSKGVKQRKK